MRYIELLPPEKRPVVGTEGAAYRRQQMARQLPEHDQDPSRCHELSPAEVKLMQQYVRKYKDEALGVGDVMLPEEMAVVQAGGLGGSSVGVGGAPSAGGAEFGPRGGAAAGSIGGGGGAGYKPEAGVAGVGFGSGPGAAGPGVGAGAGGGFGSAAGGVGAGGGFGPAAGGAGAGGGPLSGPGVGPSAGFGPAGGAMGTTATAGAMSVPGAQQAGLPQQNFVSFFPPSVH